MVFPAPKDFVPPENVGASGEEATEFEALGTFKIEPKGQLRLLAVDGKPIKGPYKKEEEAETESPGFTASVMQKMRS
jgi:hypothetical protein